MRCHPWWGTKCEELLWLRGVRVGEASHPGPPGQSPNDILCDLEAVLTRIDSLDEEALVRPTIGRHVIRKVHEEQRRLVPLDHSESPESAIFVRRRVGC